MSQQTFFFGVVLLPLLLAEIVSRNPLARPPLRPYEVFVTRRVPLVVYTKRCIKLLRGPYAKAVIRGTSSCIETAVFVAQDVVAAFGGQVIYSCSITDSKQAPNCAGAATPAATTAATKGAARTPAALKASAAAEATTGKAEAVFAAVASKLAAACGSSTNAALLSLSADTSSAQAYDEVVSLGNKNNNSEDEEALEAAGLHQELCVSKQTYTLLSVKFIYMVVQFCCCYFHLLCCYALRILLVL